MPFTRRLEWTHKTFDDIFFPQKDIHDRDAERDIAHKSLDAKAYQEKDVSFVMTRYSNMKDDVPQGHYIYCRQCKKFGRAHLVYKDKGENMEWVHKRNIDETIRQVQYKKSMNATNGNYMMTSVTYNDSTRVNTMISRIELDSVICPHCGLHETFDNVIQLSSKGGSNRYRIFEGIFDNGRTIKLRWLERFITGFNGKIQFHTFSQHMHFNIETGQSYIVEPWVDGKRQKSYTGPKIKNITYMFGRTTQPTFEQETIAALAELIHKKKVAYLGYNVPSIFDYLDRDRAKFEKLSDEERRSMRRAKSVLIKLPSNNRGTSSSWTTTVQSNTAVTGEWITLNGNETATTGIPKNVGWSKNSRYEMQFDNEIRLEDVTLYNRVPNIDPAVYGTFVHTVKNKFGYTNNKILPKIKANTDNPIGDIMTAFKIPKVKSIRKVLIEKPTLAITIGFVITYFKDIANINKLITKKYEIDRNMEEVDKFLKMLINEFGETIVANKLAHEKCDSVILRDTATLYSQIRRLDPDLPLDIKGSIRELHDDYTTIRNKIKTGNIKFNYSEKQLELNDHIDGYDLILCQESKDIKITGMKMRICVGGYVDNVMNGNCNIVTMMKDGKHVMCIELSGDLKTIHQAKIHCNNRPAGLPLDVIMRWAQKHKLKIQTGDLPDMKKYFEEEHTDLEEIDADAILAKNPNYGRGWIRELNEEERIAAGETVDVVVEPVAEATIAVQNFEIANNYVIHVQGNEQIIAV